MRPEVLNALFCKIDTLKGVGSRYLKLISNLIGGDKIVHLLWHLPYNIVDRTYTCKINEIVPNKIWTGLVRVEQHIEPKTKKQPYRIVVCDETADLTLTFFKYYKDSLKKQLPVGSQKVISGKTEFFNGFLSINHPDYIADISAFNDINTLEPVYPLCAGITNKMMRHLSSQALSRVSDFQEWQDKLFIQKNNFPSFKEALQTVHFPKAITDLVPQSPARQRLAYDEFLANQLTLALARRQNKKRFGRAVEGGGHLRSKLISCLGFELTDAQKRVLSEIYQDQKSPFQALRLVQGDVGAGKTVVAFLAMLNAVECGFQAALMAPTEILAKQHFETMQTWAKKTGVHVALLTGKIKNKARSEILEKLKTGAVDILIGTHALFTSDVSFKDLAFICIDEQHRFGVKQRLELSAKGNKPDIIVMTATPIPRTLVLTQFGDMDYSKIDELPKGRLPVDTRVMPLNKLSEVIPALKRQINQNKRAYWVCPLIEQSEKSDLAAAIERFESLEKVFGSKVGLVHGRMKESEKDAVMERFKNGDIWLLVSTTVIEVGVNVPEATIMIIERAERFGLAQLHQLRGRIKRSSEPSTCLLLYGFPLGETAKERLNILKESEDGFFLAEKDLDLRGGGDVLGTKQSGFETFKLADLSCHKNLLLTAHQDAELILSQDEKLQTTRGRALRILLYLFEQDDAFRTYISG